MDSFTQSLSSPRCGADQVAHASSAACIAPAQAHQLSAEGSQAAKGKRARTASEKAPAAGRPVVLVVDDEPAICTMAARMLERGGFRTISACNGQEALSIHGQHSDEIAAVLLDITMPVMDGMTAFPQLRERQPNLPVLFTSGYTDQDWSGLTAGDARTGFLQKPYSASDLLGALRHMLSIA